MIFEGLGQSFSLVNIISTSINEPVNIVAADMDQDGDLHVFVASSGYPPLRWLENKDSRGTFSVDHTIPFTALYYFLTTSAIPADLNGDDRLDVVVTADETFLWFKSTGDAGEFSPTSNLIDIGLLGAF